MTALPLAVEAPPGLDFTAQIRRLCVEMSARVPELSHITMDRVAVGFAQTRRRTSYGVQATLTPMRFEGGELVSVRRGRRFTIERLWNPRGEEFLYILTVYLPRFCNQPFDEKIGTVLHELWHIGPRFDGDLRRHPGRCYAHGPSQKHYDANVARLVRQWWAADPPEETYEFLHHDFARLLHAHGSIIGTKYRNPKLVPAE